MDFPPQVEATPVKPRGSTPLRSNLHFRYAQGDAPQDSSLKCTASDISLSLVHHNERLRSVAWRERAAEKSPWSTTATERHSQLGLRAIGWGSCGIVYEQHGTSYVLKKRSTMELLRTIVGCGMIQSCIRRSKKLLRAMLSGSGDRCLYMCCVVLATLVRKTRGGGRSMSACPRGNTVIQRTCCARSAFLLFT